MSKKDLEAKAKVLCVGDDAPFSIRGPHSKISYSYRKGTMIEMCLADARTLSGLRWFEIA